SGGDQSGWSVASAGDVDEDGRADVLIGAPSRETPSAPGGESYLMLGASIAAQPSGSTLSLKMAAYSFAGENSGDLSGYSVASAGDVDGDGRSDVLIGAPGDNFNSSDPEADPARVYVMLGSEIMTQAPGSPGSSFDLVNASYVLWNSFHDGGSGYSVASAGDFDGDGRSDVLIGAPARFHWSGASFLVLASDLLRSPPGSAFDLGTNAHQRWISTTGDHAGAGVAGLRDVNGDDRSDLLIGIPGYDSGVAMLVLSTHAGEPLASRLDAGTGTWGVPSFLTPGNLGCADLYHVVADDAGNAIATFNCGAGNDNVAHYSFTSDAWWGQQDIGVYGSGLSINPGGDAVATGTSIPDAQANIFR
ncbi:MAG: integrin alpha, partial [Nannocystaceae bacterium]